MCTYVLSVPLCGHSPTLLFGPSCSAISSQLDAITEPPAWEAPGLYRLPFRLPDTCLPAARNIAVVQDSDFCGGCRVEYGYAEGSPGKEGQGQRGCGGYGGHEAQDRLGHAYGRGEGGERYLGRWPGLEMYWEPERIGVGWRT